MKFRYLTDPLFMICLALYAINRFVIKVYLPNTFSISYLNDIMCIPFWVPIMLFIMRRLGLRRGDQPPQSYEILIPLILWSVVFEIWLPRVPIFYGLANADHRDILFYTLGALIAAIWWQRYYPIPNPSHSNSKASS